MSVLMSILFVLLGIVVVLFLIMIHELGHFIFAKISKAYVFEFAIGFGPRLITFKTKETWYSIRLLPIGGFVSIASDFAEPPKGREEEYESIPDNRKIDYISKWKKSIFILAGPLVNLVFAFILIMSVFLANGYKANDMNFYGQVFTQDSIALKLIDDNEKNLEIEPKSQKIAISGMKINVNGVDKTATIESPKYTDIVYGIKDVLDPINESLKTTPLNKVLIQFDYFILADKYSDQTIGDPKQTKLQEISDDVLAKWSTNKSISIGIAPPTRYFENGIDAFSYSFVETWNQSISLIVGLGKFFAGDFTALSGPIGMFSVESSSPTTPSTNYALYIAGISANLFMLNALPFPPLDGYKFWENIYEWITKREVNKKVKTIIYIVGAILLLLLLVIVTIKDIII